MVGGGGGGGGEHVLLGEKHTLPPLPQLNSTVIVVKFGCHEN